MRRDATVMGQFYPETTEELRGMCRRWSDDSIQLPEGFTPRAALLPHAGYIFSGKTAFRALSLLAPQRFERMVIIGPSHRHAFEGISTCRADRYESLDGDVRVDTEFTSQLTTELSLNQISLAHHEHSTEVQVPLLQFLAPALPIVEIVYGSRAERDLTALIENLYNSPDTGIIVSSDLSHYYSEGDAHALDEYVIDAVKRMDKHLLEHGEACGKAGISAVIQASLRRGLTSSIVEYCTSADSEYGESDRVVGYLSALFGEQS